MRINSLRKGKRGELEWVQFLKENGFDCRRGRQYNGIEGEDVVGLPGIHQEVKRVEKLKIHDAISQSIQDAKNDDIPIVAHRKNRAKWLVTLQAEDFVRMYKAWIDQITEEEK